MHLRKRSVLLLGFVDGLVLGLGFCLGVALTFLVYIDGSNLRAYMLSALLGAAGLVLVFFFGVLPRLMGVGLWVVMDVFAVLALLVYGFLAYLEVHGGERQARRL